jgi:hypothetical protein
MKLVLASLALAIGVTPVVADVSAAKKRYPHYRASGPADPSFDRYGRPYRPTVQGPCMVDLGYGRFARCDGSL